MKTMVAFAALAVMLAGCSNDAPAEAEAENPAPADDGNQTAAPVNVTVPAPLAKLNATVSNGTAPLQVNYTLDAQGNWTHWSFAFGEGNFTEGTELPAMLNFTYMEGLWNASLTVFGPGGNTTAIAAVNVTAGVPEVLVLEPWQETISMTTPCTGCKAGTSSCLWRLTGGATPRDCGWIDFPDEYAGQPYTLTGTGLDPDGLFWNGACNDGVGQRVSTNLAPEAGTIPSEAACILVWEAADFLVDVTFTITPAA